MKIAIAGAAGRMGLSVVRSALARGWTVSGATQRTGSDAIGKGLGALAGLSSLDVTVTADPAVAAAGADVWIDFSTPDATRLGIAAASRAVRAAVIGTTGLDPAAEAAVAEAAKRIPIVRSGNFSRGVTALASVVRQLAGKLGPDWDIEIIETHHRRKVDAPSGTALLLGEAAAKGRGQSLQDLRVPVREGVTGSRPEGGIGFASLRAGGVIGEHTVIFANESESLRLSHVAQDRALFAEGALDAAAWAAEQPPGLYGMADVLAL